MSASSLIRSSLVLSLALGAGCQRSLPHVGRHQAAPPVDATPSVHPVPANSSPLLALEDGWKSSHSADAVSANGAPLAAMSTATSPETALLPSHGMPPAPSDAEILQTQFQAAGQAMPKEWEALHQRLAQQAAVNTALTQAVVDLQKQAEAHHRDLVRLAEETNTRQQRNDKVTEEILSLIEQMSQHSAAPGSPPAAPAPAPAPALAPSPAPAPPSPMGGTNP